MGLFWDYFKSGLRWPLIQRAGALAALVEGAAKSLDQAREDVLWLRRQFHPATCEDEFLDRFAEARGLKRHPRESAEQWRARVVLAFAWQRLGGSQSGMPRILAHYGYPGATFSNCRDEDEARWAEFRIRLSPGKPIALADFELIDWVVQEAKPARSMLASLDIEVASRTQAPTLAAALLLGETITIEPWTPSTLTASRAVVHAVGWQAVEATTIYPQ